MAAKKKAKAKVEIAGARVVGDVVDMALAAVKPNGWNPNRVPDHIMKSIEHGFRTDGWIKSQALLIWGTDETGAQQNIIIDGEHRWRGAQAVGLTTGPMVFLHGLSEAEAKALTIKMNQKRGEWDRDALTQLIAQFDGDALAQSLEFGFAEEEMFAMLAAVDVELPAMEPPPVGDADKAYDTTPDGRRIAPIDPIPAVKVVQLVYGAEDHAAFAENFKRLATEGQTLSALVLKLLKEA